MSIVLDRERTREARRERWLEQGLGQYETELRARKKCADERKAQEQKTEEEGRPEWNGGTSTTDTHRTTSEGRRRRRPSSPVATRLVSGALARGATKIVAREIVRQSLADVDAEERAKPLYRLLSQLAKSSHGEDSKDDDNSHHLDALAAGIDLLDNFDLIDAENCLCVPPGRDLAGRGGDANASIAVLAAALSQSGSTIARLEFLPGVAHDPAHVIALLDALAVVPPNNTNNDEVRMKSGGGGRGRLPARFASIILSHANLHDDGADAVARCIRSCDGMTTGIDVSWNYFTDTGLRAICDAIRDRAGLDLPVTDDAVGEDNLMIEQHLFKYAVDLSFCGSVTQPALITGVTRMLPALHSLRLAGAGISGEKNCRALAKGLARAGDGLVLLDLSGNGLGPLGIDLIARGLGSGRTTCHTIVEELDLSRVMTSVGTGHGGGEMFPFPSVVIANLASTAFRRLHTLRLAGNGITACDVGRMIGDWVDDTLVVGGSGLASCHALQHVDLSENNIGECSSDVEKLGRRRLLRWLALDDCTVCEVVLDDNGFLMAQKEHFEKSLRRRCGRERWDRLEVHLFG
jgi:hypothetical protein